MDVAARQQQGVPENGLPSYSWKDIESHTAIDDRWIVVNEVVYDVTHWQKKHPGGARIIGHFAGQDATDAWTAMHKDKKLVEKFMKPLSVGLVLPSADGDPRHSGNELLRDFRSLQKFVEESDLMRASPLFFIVHLFHLIFLEVIAYCLLIFFDVSWLTAICAGLLLVTQQAQCGWSQHDYGHLSVFSSSKLNHRVHYFIIGFLKGASAHWWNFRHYQHHVKPNIIGKDPDVHLSPLFVIGDKVPVDCAQQRYGLMPYDWQHVYFWFIGCPLVIPVFFHFDNLYFIFKRKDWIDLAWMSTFYIRFYLFYSPILGFWGSFCLYFFIRILESHWFTLVTQMNHIPMDVNDDHNNEWVTSMALTTCNIEPSFFNDWFTGHLNYQIEHHLFPRMPRHNYHKVKPLVKSLFKKHNLRYVEKSLLQALIDIHKALLKGGQLWRDAYEN